MTFHVRSRSVLLALLATAAFSAAGCGGGGSSDGGADAQDSRTAPNGDVFNTTDVKFAKSAIPHHAQAVQMVIIAQGRPLDAKAATLAEAIRDEHVVEVEKMSDWLTAWGEQVPETSLSHANAGHDEDGLGEGSDAAGASNVPGAVAAKDMSALEKASDEEFQDTWLAMMLEHHQGAVELARQEQRQGIFGPAIKLAAEIETVQGRQIETIEDLLG
jgi:uncharacterized protein (DUF305 family)